jgi:hypothetical protein
MVDQRIMKRRRIFLSSLFFFIAIQLICLQDALAYLDPGSGSYVFQVMVAAFIGGLFTIKMFWKKIINFLSNHFSRKQRP